MSKVVVTKYDEGPYVIKGEFELVDGKGNVFQTGESVAVCRCGQSKTQPFCDGTHRTCGFREASEAR
ncbi:CDGSH iron-sulfur domain-containing protein [Cohnella sp. CFH 77786]|uniref:CDGSH iron-sulfur domain-containing protein n=1 Tax=Cohnella sp. CFH 77786 TaxID=2662265 RepID=UPI001C610CFA|nr:CDGSH iron-sulfur domain-containing protein [Cohnella sp. CFH 77786]MBW5448270.1 CDGSH iron-sulfur domain-containing protein [Cohnella sp. CFH 77786]